MQVEVSKEGDSLAKVGTLKRDFAEVSFPFTSVTFFLQGGVIAGGAAAFLALAGVIIANLPDVDAI